jgi:hypothetical protein
MKVTTEFTVPRPVAFLVEREIAGKIVLGRISVWRRSLGTLRWWWIGSTFGPVKVWLRGSLNVRVHHSRYPHVLVNTVLGIHFPCLRARPNRVVVVVADLLVHQVGHAVSAAVLAPVDLHQVPSVRPSLQALVASSALGDPASGIPYDLPRWAAPFDRQSVDAAVERVHVPVFRHEPYVHYEKRQSPSWKVAYSQPRIVDKAPRNNPTRPIDCDRPRHFSPLFPQHHAVSCWLLDRMLLEFLAAPYHTCSSADRLPFLRKQPRIPNSPEIQCCTKQWIVDSWRNEYTSNPTVLQLL